MITSTANPRFKALLALRDAAGRRAAGRYLIEGHRELGRALASGVPVLEVAVCEEAFGSRRATAESVLAAAQRAGAERIDLAPHVAARLSGRENPDGLIGVARLVPSTLADLRLPENPLVLVVEQVEKPGNLGAILRTAEAAGVSGVIATDPATDFQNPHVIRAAQGASFALRTAGASLPDTLAWLARQGLAVAATTPAAEIPVWDFDATGPTAIVLGSEARGLSPEWLAAPRGNGANTAGADRPRITPVSLPMAGIADSLNVAATAAITLFEAVRQRRVAAGGRAPRP